jgi:hypothetical protein
MTNRTISDYQRLAHEQAVARGEYDCKVVHRDRYSYVLDLTSDPEWIAGRLCAIHAAISRAYECVVAGETRLAWKHPQAGATEIGVAEHDPIMQANHLRALGYTRLVGLPAELARVFLLLCDFSKAVDWEDIDLPLKPAPSDAPRALAIEILELHRAVPQFDRLDFVWVTVRQLRGLCRDHNIDLFAAADLVLEYEARR